MRFVVFIVPSIQWDFSIRNLMTFSSGKFSSFIFLIINFIWSEDSLALKIGGLIFSYFMFYFPISCLYVLHLKYTFLQLL